MLPKGVKREKLPPSVQQRKRNPDPLKDYWRTPDILFNNINRRFNFGLDIAADESNAKVDFYLTEYSDSLSCSWDLTDLPVWCNPPFSLKEDFVFKAVQEMRHNGVCTTMILPCTPDVSWFHSHIIGTAHEVWLFKGRVQYVPAIGSGEKHGCSFPSMLVVWDGRREQGPTFFGSLTTQGIPFKDVDVAVWGCC